MFNTMRARIGSVRFSALAAIALAGVSLAYAASARHLDGSSAIWLMNGLSPTGVAGLLGAGTVWSASHAADLKGDGKGDIVWQHVDGSAVVWEMNGVSPSGVTGLIGAGTGWSIKQIANYDGDPSNDLLWQHTDGSSAVWIRSGQTVTAGGLLDSNTGWNLAP